MFRFIIVILFLDSSQFVLTQWGIDDRGCRTPHKGVGDCIPIKECQPIVNIMLQTFPLPEYIAEELQLYRCGVTKTSVKVCCPYNSESLNYLIFPTTRLQGSNSVFNHDHLDLLPKDCGLLQSSVRIVHGRLTDLFEFPWMALLSYKKDDEIDFKCAGTVINKWYILTAAHCITELKKLKLIGVRLGEYNISSPIDCVEFLPGDTTCAEPVQDIGIGKAIPHLNFNSTTQENDIGLIRLARPMNMSVENVKSICLPITEALANQNFNNKKLTVTGWGYTETANKSEVLLKVDVPVVNMKDCQKAYNRSGIEISMNQICAGGIVGDSCGGDSGGPLQHLVEHLNEVRYVQHGIVSFGTKFCGLTNVPGVYTRVNPYMKWILDNIEP